MVRVDCQRLQCAACDLGKILDGDVRHRKIVVRIESLRLKFDDFQVAVNCSKVVALFTQDYAQIEISRAQCWIELNSFAITFYRSLLLIVLRLQNSQIEMGVRVARHLQQHLALHLQRFVNFSLVDFLHYQFIQSGEIKQIRMMGRGSNVAAFVGWRHENY